MNEFDRLVANFKRGLVRDLLARLTDEQRAFFNRVYVDVETMAADRLHAAYDLCQRTLIKNAKEGM